MIKSVRRQSFLEAMASQAKGAFGSLFRFNCAANDVGGWPQHCKTLLTFIAVFDQYSLLIVTEGSAWVND